MTSQGLSQSSSLENPLVLIVDDDPVQRCLMQECLEQAGCHFDQAESAEEALKKVETITPEIFMLDVVMPGMDGFELCRLIREKPEFAYTPIVMVTGLEDIASIDKAFQSGATSFLPKPMHWNLLPHYIRFMARAGRSEQNLASALEEAESANRAKTEFLANMSHELRTPLNAVIGFSEVIHDQIDGFLSKDKVKEYAYDIRSSGKHLLEIVNSILDLAKIASGTMEPQFDLVSVESTIEAALQIVAGEAESRAISLEVVPCGVTSPIFADELMLRQVLVNLLSNSIKFSNENGFVKIGCQPTASGGTVITVQDNGIGIAAEHIPHILEPFTQVDSALARNYEGTGLGLPLSKSFMELHGGTLEIQSTPDEGTTVKVELPRSESVNGISSSDGDVAASHRIADLAS